MTGQVTVVENEMTEQGLIRVHLLSADQAALTEEAARRIRTVSAESYDFLKTLAYVEAGIRHALLMWPARGELVDIKAGPSDDMASGRMVLWVIRGDETVSWAVERATWFYLALTGELPATAWLGKRISQYAGRVVKVGEREIPLVAAEWMADQGVGVGIEWAKGAKE